MGEASFSQKLIMFFAPLTGLTAYGAILGMLLICGLGVPIPEDITLISAGILVSLGNISMGGAIAVGMFGVLAGDGFLFFMGRKYGRRAFELPGIRKIMTPSRIKLAEVKIQEHGRFICFMARFIPGLRSPIYLSSGVMGVSPWTFLMQDGLAALLSVPAWIVFGWYFGNNIDQLLSIAKQVQIYLFATVIVAIIGYVWWKVRRKPFSRS